MSAADGAPPAAAVRLRNLTKRYGARRALAGLDLELAGAEIVGVIGPDGAGKTTLLRSLAGLLEVEADEATVLGFDLRGDVRPLKARLGYVPQAFSLHGDLSVLENLRFTARLHRIPEDELACRAGPLLERTGLAPFGDRRAAALSGGMKQKLAIVNALLPGPALLVLDEPTAGVDIVARGEIWTLLAERRAQMLIVLSTSYLDEAAGCDHLVYLDGGRVVASGTPTELRAQVAVALYRAWGPSADAVAAAARGVPWVEGAYASGRYARVEVRPDGPPESEVRRVLAALPGTPVHLVERVPIDLEATLLGLARRSAA